MKRALQVLSILALVSIAAFAARSFNNPNEAAMNSPVISQYLNQGFTLDAVTPNQYRYFAAPSGTYMWGTVTVQLHGRTGGPNSLETTYATVTCYVQAKDQGSTTKFSTVDTDEYLQVVY